MTTTVQEFAASLEREQRARYEHDYPVTAASSVFQDGTTRYRAAVHVGPKYTRVDFDGSGKYMVVNATGEIFGIKGYGVIHRGHAYGTLDTIALWDWSGYRARPRAMPA
jgi:hypothetical protein